MDIRKTFFKTLVLSAGFCIALTAAAWTGPTGTAPNNNIDAPINVGPTAQSKAAGLILNTGGATNGLIVSSGKVGIGTVSPSHLLTLSDALAIIKLNRPSNAASNYSLVSFMTNDVNKFMIGMDADTQTGVDKLGIYDAAVSGTAPVMTFTGGVVGVGNTSPSGAKLVVGSVNGQSNALIVARNAVANDVEFGHANQAGYGSVLGHDNGGGQPFVCFSCEAGTNSNTYRTRGLVGSIMKGDLSGGFQWGKIATANADNQPLTQTLYLSNTGTLTAAGDVCSTSSGKCLSTAGGGPITLGGFYEVNASNGTCQINNPWTGSCSCPAYAPNAHYSMLATACCSFTEYQYICTN